MRLDSLSHMKGSWQLLLVFACGLTAGLLGALHERWTPGDTAGVVFCCAGMLWALALIRKEKTAENSK